MKVFNFSAYFKAIRNNIAETVTGPTIVQDLLSGMIVQGRIPQKMVDFAYPNSTCSRYINGPFLPPWIISAANHPATVRDYPNHIKEFVLPNISKDRIDNLLNEISSLLNECANVSESHRTNCLALISVTRTEDQICDFLARTLLYAINQSRNPKDGRKKNKLKENPLPKIEPPVAIDVDEQKYVSALLESYEEADNTTYSISNVGKNAEHFIRQRTDFYNADYARIQSREVFSDEEVNPFDVLLDEIYNGVIDEWERPHENGLECLRETLKQAVQVQSGKSKVAKETNWIGPAEKKGACHILVNEGKISGWVKKKE